MPRMWSSSKIPQFDIKLSHMLIFIYIYILIIYYFVVCWHSFFSISGHFFFSSHLISNIEFFSSPRIILFVISRLLIIYAVIIIIMWLTTFYEEEMLYEHHIRIMPRMWLKKWKTAGKMMRCFIVWHRLLFCYHLLISFAWIAEAHLILWLSMCFYWIENIQNMQIECRHHFREMTNVINQKELMIEKTQNNVIYFGSGIPQQNAAMICIWHKDQYKYTYIRVCMRACYNVRNEKIVS